MRNFNSNIMKLIKNNRKKFIVDSGDSSQRYYLSPSRYNRHMISKKLILKYCKGNALDIGCGDMSYRKFILGTTDNYDGLDINKNSPDLKYVADIQNMLVVPSGKYDFVLCLEVLEHVPEPSKAINEIYRVLNNNGIVVISVPHLSRMHELPHDYYRFTRFGLKFMLENAGFKILELFPRSGLFSFLGHQISTILIGLTWHIQIINKIIFFLNKWIIVKGCLLLDNYTDKNNYFPLGHFCVAQKIKFI